MSTHEDLLNLESRTRIPRVGIVAVCLIASATVTGSWSVVGSSVFLGILYGFFTVGFRFYVTPRFRSDAWVYGMLIGDAIFTVFAASVIGLSGPLIVLPVLIAGYYTLFLRYKGALLAGILGAACMILAFVVSGVIDVGLIILSVGLVFSIAAITSYVGSQRSNEISRRRSDNLMFNQNADASRILSALQPVALALNRKEWSEAVANSLPGITGFAQVYVYLCRPNDRTPEQLAHAGYVQLDLQKDEDLTVLEAERVISDGIASVIPIDRIPVDLSAANFQIGIAAPLISFGRSAGAICLYSTAPKISIQKALDQVEIYLCYAARFLLALEGRPVALHKGDRLTSELVAAGREKFPVTRPAVTLNGIKLDPVYERSTVGGVAVSLSRSEFDLLYTLASSPGDVLSPKALEPQGREGSRVDITIHRLRRKLGRCPNGDDLIRTVRGQGYTLIAPGN